MNENLTTEQLSGIAFDVLDSVEQNVLILLATVRQSKECADLGCLDEMIRIVEEDLANVKGAVTVVTNACDMYWVERDRVVISAK